MTKTTFTLSLVTITALLTTPAFAETELDPIVVSSDFRETKLSQTSTLFFSKIQQSIIFSHV